MQRVNSYNINDNFIVKNNKLLFEYIIGNEPIGQCLIRLSKIEHKTGKLEYIEIYPKYRNKKKYGPYLIKYVINFLKSKNVKSLYGIVNPEDKSKLFNLLRWYHKHKFNIHYNKTDIFIKQQLNTFDLSKF
jgi:hypothetical protein